MRRASHDVDVAGLGVDSRASGCGMVCSVCVTPVVTRGVRVNIVNASVSYAVSSVRFYISSLALAAPPARGIYKVESGVTKSKMMCAW